MITVLRFKDFQGPFTSNSKTFKDLFHFQGLSRPWKNDNFFKDFQGPVATLCKLVYTVITSTAERSKILRLFIRIFCNQKPNPNQKLPKCFW